MGVQTRMVVYAHDETSATAACSAAFHRVAELDAILSDYRADSELNCLTRGEVNTWHPVSRDLHRVLVMGQRVSEASGGSFDLTVGPLVRLWRQARKDRRLPAEGDISQARSRVGWQKLSVDPRHPRVRFTTPGMQLDCGGIAKGYACDQAQAELRKQGITRALVEMGGDLVVTGPPPGERGWTIALPNDVAAGGVAKQTFRHCAISSSGDTEQFAEIGGVRYSHVVDPRTGWSLTNRIQTTVVTRYGLVSDPISTALGVMGPSGTDTLKASFPLTQVWVRKLEFGTKE